MHLCTCYLQQLGPQKWSTQSHDPGCMGDVLSHSWVLSVYKSFLLQPEQNSTSQGLKTTGIYYLIVLEGQKPEISITELKGRCRQGSIPSGSPRGEFMFSSFWGPPAVLGTWPFLHLPSCQPSIFIIWLWLSASIVTSPSPTLIFLPPSYGDNPASSSHLKILNLISSAKSLSPRKVLSYSRAPGIRTGTSLGTLTTFHRDCVAREPHSLRSPHFFQPEFPHL